MGILRILLAISVVIAHTSPLFGIGMVGGKIAVEAFYIISGFYMTMILNEKYIGKNGDYWLFISNRLLRLMPVYWTVLILTVLFCAFNKTIMSSTGYSLDLYNNYVLTIKTWCFMIISQLIVIGQDVVMFLGLNTDGSLFFTSNFSETDPRLFKFLFIPQAWTISIEICFYLIAPFVLRKNWKWILLFLIFSFSVRIYIFYGLKLTNDPWNYRFLPSELMFFFMGYFSYRLSKFLINKNINKWLFYINFIFLIFLILYYSKVPTFGFRDSFKESMFFIYFTLSIPMLFNHFKMNKIDYKIGELSYPIYLSHGLVILVIYNFGDFSEYLVIPVLILTILLSFVLNSYINVPIERIRQKRIKNALNE